LAIGKEIGEAMDVRPLKVDPTFVMDIKGKPVLYRPTIFNYKAIDGLVVLIKLEKRGKKPKMCLFPPQITVAKKHSDSRTKFFEAYNEWKKYFSGYDVDHPGTGQHSIPPEDSSMTSTSRALHSSRDVSEMIWMNYQIARDAIN
jgi:hypothetical protein